MGLEANPKTIPIPFIEMVGLQYLGTSLGIELKLLSLLGKGTERLGQGKVKLIVCRGGKD